jgi:hypothetical protein
MKRTFRTHIENTSKAQVFNLIANIDTYDSWLPNSDTFLGIRHVSDTPIKEGTTYTDGQGRLQMHGEVEVYDPNEQIIFHQVSNFRAFGLIPSGLNVTIDYILVQEHSGTTVIRNYEIEFKGILKLIRPTVLSRINAENERILYLMKTLLEKTY